MKEPEVFRGFVFGDEGRALIVTPTREPVRAYSLRDAMDVLAREGWRPTELSHDEAFWFDARQRRAVPALLRTRCGCTKPHAVEWPPPEVIRVALHTPLRLPVDWAADITVRLRTFDRVTHWREAGEPEQRRYRLFYEERAE